MRNPPSWLPPLLLASLAVLCTACSGLSLPPIPKRLKILGPGDTVEAQLPPREETQTFFEDADKSLFRPIHFRPQSFLVARHSLDALAEAAGSAIENGKSLFVGGFTRPGLSPEYDRTVAEQLALEVRRLLIANGLPPERVQTIGLGSDAPSQSPDVAAAKRWVIIAAYQ